MYRSFGLRSPRRINQTSNSSGMFPRCNKVPTNFPLFLSPPLHKEFQSDITRNTNVFLARWSNIYSKFTGLNVSYWPWKKFKIKKNIKFFENVCPRCNKLPSPISLYFYPLHKEFQSDLTRNTNIYIYIFSARIIYSVQVYRMKRAVLEEKFKYRSEKKNRYQTLRE